jgi:iron(II)-dependent oxidoreductase
MALKGLLAIIHRRAARPEDTVCGTATSNPRSFDTPSLNGALMTSTFSPTTNDLISDAREAAARVLEITDLLGGSQLYGPMIPIVNPAAWEVGHVGWFFEKWTLRNLYAAASMVDGADALYDSSVIPHDTRWNLTLPSWQATRGYLTSVVEKALARVDGRELTPEEVYFLRLSVLHTDMHAEALTYTRQTLGYPEPGFATPFVRPEAPAGFDPHDVFIPGGTFQLGPAPGEEPFVFDNEKWGHEVKVSPFRMSATAVSNEEFLAFVEAGGYRDREVWSEIGWAWREATGAERPIYWRRAAGGTWSLRRYDREVPLVPKAAMIHVNWHEASAYCKWAGRRLPTEPEWELAAAGGLDGATKRRFPWGDEPPTPERANLDFRGRGPVDVRALPDGDSRFGVRQMIGQAWEWTSTDFAPYPGFVTDPYKEYSEPWFYNHKVLRGGAWSTRSRLIRNTWRNFYTPDRRDVMCGLRTCAL